MMRRVADKIATQIPEKADRVVLDVSGDQRETAIRENSNDLRVRRELVGEGVVINGLPILEGEWTVSCLRAGTVRTLWGARVRLCFPLTVCASHSRLRGFWTRLQAEIHSRDQ